VVQRLIDLERRSAAAERAALTARVGELEARLATRGGD
jgi:BMFP domain-containing protein YqiC